IAAKLVTTYEASVAKTIGRKQRKHLEDIAPHLASPQNRPVPIDVLIGALVRAELRTAYVVSGDLLATVDEIRAMDPMLMAATEVPGPEALASVLEHPLAGDVTRFAMSPEATALRRRVGSAWAG